MLLNFDETFLGVMMDIVTVPLDMIIARNIHKDPRFYTVFIVPLCVCLLVYFCVKDILKGAKSFTWYVCGSFTALFVTGVYIFSIFGIVTFYATL